VDALFLAISAQTLAGLNTVGYPQFVRRKDCIGAVAGETDMGDSRSICQL